MERLRRDLERAEAIGRSERRIESEKALAKRSETLLQAIADAEASKRQLSKASDDSAAADAHVCELRRRNEELRARLDATERLRIESQRPIEEEALVKELRREMASRDQTIERLRSEVDARDASHLKDALKERDLELRALRQEVDDGS